MGATDTPFSGVTIADANSGAQDTLTITLTGAGTLADGTGFSGLTASGDVYTLTGSASAITSELDALAFTPGAAGTPNTAATTAFALNDTSSGDPTATADESLSVNVLTPAVAPTITGTLANQSLTVGSTDTPFSKVTIGDANANAFDTLTITLTGAGALADGATFSGLISSGDVYTLAGTASAITGELDALVFTPGAAGTPNATATTSFALSDKSSVILRSLRISRHLTPTTERVRIPHWRRTPRATCSGRPARAEPLTMASSSRSPRRAPATPPPRRS